MKRGALLLALLLLPSGGAAQRRGGLTRRGLEALRAATVVDSMDAEAYYRYGLGLWERHRYAAADSAFHRALRLAPWHPGAHLALGSLPFGRGERSLFELRSRLTPDSLQSYFRGVAHHTRTAFLNDPLVELTPLRFVDLDELLPVGGAPNCTEGPCRPTARGSRWPGPTRRAVRLLLDGRTDSAYVLLSALLDGRRPEESVPDDVIWYFALAADRSGHPADAAEGFRELAQRTERRERTGIGRATMTRERDLLLILYGMACARSDQHVLARLAYREALVADLSTYQAHSRIADLSEAEGDLAEMLDERRAAAQDVLAEREQIEYGRTLLQLGQTEAAIDALLEASARLPWDPGTQLLLFQAAMAVNDRATAQHALAALELFAPQRNQEQVADARRRFAESATP